MKKRNHKPPCTCRTGTYCHRHLRYGLEWDRPSTLTSAREPTLDNHRCGGGLRVIRKKMRGD